LLLNVLLRSGVPLGALAPAWAAQTIAMPNTTLSIKVAVHRLILFITYLLLEMVTTAF
jgi:hypothetical protein